MATLSHDIVTSAFVIGGLLGTLATFGMLH
jgi:hypothetical protein